MKYIINLPVLILLLAVLSGCGYQLRGSQSLPSEMSVTYVKGMQPYSALVTDFSHALRTRNITVTTDPEAATALLAIRGNEVEKLVLSVDAAGNVLEFEIRQTIRFAVLDAAQTELLGEQSVSLSRDFLFTSTDVLAKAREEVLVRQTLQKEIINLAILRIAALGK